MFNLSVQKSSPQKIPNEPLVVIYNQPPQDFGEGEAIMHDSLCQNLSKTKTFKDGVGQMVLGVTELMNKNALKKQLKNT